MSYLGIENADDFRVWRQTLHGRFTTPHDELEAILNSWEMSNFIIGDRIVTGEATEVYPVYDCATLDVLGYLRIAHGTSMNSTEMVLMKACQKANLPTVKMLHGSSKRSDNTPISHGQAITFLAPAQGENLLDLIGGKHFKPDKLKVAITNAGVLLAQIHDLPKCNPDIATTIEVGHRELQRDHFRRILSDLRKRMQLVPEATTLLDQIVRSERDVTSAFKDLKRVYPPVLVHADFDPKHIFIDEQTGVITSLIDFGGAHVNLPHFDFVHWRTYSDSTYEMFLNAYLETRFGNDQVAAKDFTQGIDVADALCHLISARTRLDHLLVPEAVGHLGLCADACARVVNQTRPPHAQLAEVAR